MPLYRQRYVFIGRDGQEVVAWRYTDRQGRVAAKPQAPAKPAPAPPQPSPAPIPIETVETTTPPPVQSVELPPPPAVDVAEARQSQANDERNQLMAELARQVSEFGDRIAKLEARTEDVATWGAEKVGDVRERLEALARTVARIETHDKRQDERLSRLEANLAAHDDRLERIEGALGTLAEAAEAVAQRAST
jgi:ABC-type transporter Mla subunit MlaD